MIIYIPVRKSILARLGYDYIESVIEDVKYDDFEANEDALPLSQEDIKDRILRKERKKRFRSVF